jgi:hypothetical protein
VPELLARVLATYTIADVSVEDQPLEEVIAEVFESVAEGESSTQEAKDAASAVAGASQR